MGAVTLTPLNKCRTKGCPFTPDEHDEWMDLCSRAPEHGHRHDQPTHQHHPKIGMGGNNPLSKIVAVLCWPFHDRVDNGDFGNDVKEMPGRGRVYFAWDVHGNKLIEKDLDSVLSAAAEGEKDSKVPSGRQEPLGSAEVPEPIEARLEGQPLAAAPSAGQSKEESDGQSDGARIQEDVPEGETRGGTTGERARSAGIPGGGAGGELHVAPGNVDDSRAPSSLTHDQRVAIAQAIKDAEWNRQWFAGDTGNLWIEQLGESAEQYLSDFGYVHESLANILRVCAKIPPAYRNGNLRFSHHVVVAGENLEDVEMHLAECADEGWSVAEFRRQRKGTKPRVKRWSLEELRAAYESTDYCFHISEWLGWLEEQA